MFEKVLKIQLACCGGFFLAGYAGAILGTIWMIGPWLNGVSEDFLYAPGMVYSIAVLFAWAMGLAAFCLVTFMIIPKQLMSLFTTDQTIIASAAIYLAIVGINLFPKSGNIIVGSGIRGYGNTKWMLGTQILGTILVTGIAAIFVFGFKVGITGVFLAVCADEFIRCIINTLKLLRITRKNKV